MQRAVQQALDTSSSSSRNSNDEQCSLNKLAFLLLGYGRPSGVIAAAQARLQLQQTGVPLAMYGDAELRSRSFLPAARFSSDSGGCDLQLGCILYFSQDLQQAEERLR
jgi:hypothetical protein